MGVEEKKDKVIFLTQQLNFLIRRRQEQALQEAFRRADNSSEGKLTVDDYLKVMMVVIFYVDVVDDYNDEVTDDL